MSDSVIGALRVVLGADTAALTKGLDDARGQLSRFGSEIAVTGAAIAAAVTAAYGAVSLGVSNTLRSMDEIGKQSQKIGIPVEQLSALQLAAGLSGISMEQLGTGMGKLSKAMVEAVGTPTSDAANQFRALGVQVTDATGRLRPVIDVTKDISTKFESMDAGAGKTAASLRLFGKSGADLIPLLNLGGQGITDMIKRAEALGITFDTKTSVAAEKFRDTLTLLGFAKDGLIVKLTAKMLPALQMFADRMLGAAVNVEKQQQKLNFLTSAFEAAARGVLLVCDNMKILLQLGAVFVGAQMAAMVVNLGVAFVGLARAIQATGLVMAAVEAIRKVSLVGWLTLAGGLAVITGNFDTMVTKLKEIGGAVSAALPDSGGALSNALQGLGIDLSALTVDLSKYNSTLDLAKKKQDDYNAAAAAGKQAIDQYLDGQKKSLAAQQADFDATGMASGAKERLKTILQGLAVVTASKLPLDEEHRQKLIDQANAAELLGLKLGNLALIGETNPLAAISLQIDATNAKLASGSLSIDDYAKLSGQAAQLTSKLWADSAASMGGSFESIGSSLSSMNQGWAKAAKVGQAIGAAVAFINAYVAASQAMTSAVFPANIAIAAGVLAKGLAMVASIKSVGFAQGGLVQGPGTGQSDSIPAMLSNGEFVMRAAAVRNIGLPALGALNKGMALDEVDTGHSGDRGSRHVIDVSGLGRKTYNREEIVEIIEGINDALGDNHILRITQ